MSTITTTFAIALVVSLILYAKAFDGKNKEWKKFTFKVTISSFLALLISSIQVIV